MIFLFEKQFLRGMTTFAFRPIVQAPWRWRQKDENSRQPGLYETLLINKRKLQRNQQLLQNIRNNCQIPCGFGLGLTRNVKRMKKEWVHRHTHTEQLASDGLCARQQNCTNYLTSALLLCTAQREGLACLSRCLQKSRLGLQTSRRKKLQLLALAYTCQSFQSLHTRLTFTLDQRKSLPSLGSERSSRERFDIPRALRHQGS